MSADDELLSKNARILARVCEAISTDGEAAGRRVLSAEYPFEPVEKQAARYKARQAMEIFVRDGFICRYSGRRLVFYGTLRLISEMMPDIFPFHPNGKSDKCHSAYWTEYPSIDHIVPLRRRGEDKASNWITTSMGRNVAKNNWTPAELGWSIRPPGNFTKWDGLTRWFLDRPAAEIDKIGSQTTKNWYRAAKEVVDQFDRGELHVADVEYSVST